MEHFVDDPDSPVVQTNSVWKLGTPFYIRYAFYGAWESWFAWFPVCTEQGKLTWLKRIWRRGVTPESEVVAHFYQYSFDKKGKWEK